MKTLDEVIKAFEICIGYYCSNAEHDVCPYFGESDMGCMKEPEKDALHYLKEYRSEKAMWEADRKGYLDWIEQYKEAREKHQQAVIELKKMKHQEIVCPKCHSEFVMLDDPDGDHAQLLKCQALLQDFYRNDPLTWDELRQMEGKPVWVEHALTKFKGWILLNRYENSFLVDVMDEWYLSENSIGITWQAYRKERE